MIPAEEVSIFDFAVLNPLGNALQMKKLSYSDGSTAGVIELYDELDYAKEYSLEAGTYYVKEISAPKNFRLNNKVYTLTVKAGETATGTG